MMGGFEWDILGGGIGFPCWDEMSLIFYFLKKKVMGKSGTDS